MRLTQHTDYAIRVLILAASRHAGGGLVSIREIAETFGISENHLMKVVHRLGQLGLLQTQRGRNGGLRLAGDPAAIRLGDVVSQVEEDMALVACFAGPSDCPLDGACALAAALDGARQAFIDTLNRHTLADLLPRPRSAQAMLLTGRIARAAMPRAVQRVR